LISAVEDASNSKELVVVEKVKMSFTVTTIGINRPEKKNCVNHATARKLDEAFRAFEEDPESPVAVLYGKGGTFCSGYDLTEVAGGTGDIIGSENFNPFNQEGLGPMVENET
jgi:enoyl-CoA hydratase/carnithine racemase